MNPEQSSPKRLLPRKASQPKLVTPPDGRLSVIAEDGEVHVPGRAVLKPHHRPFSRVWNMGNPPRISEEKSPPVYSMGDVKPTRTEKLVMAIRSNKIIARRGGYKRLICIIFLVIAAIIALAVGLTVGLRHQNSSSTSSQPYSSNPSPSSTASAAFPVGTFALNAFLDTVSTSCTSNSATWRCYPYTTYPDSPSGALAIFNWIISGSPGSYVISSTTNPFAINFSDAPLSLLDANTAAERYTFSILINKVVVPSVAITSDNTMAACDFNNTQFQANLYTRMPNTYPANSSTTTSASTSTPTGTGSGGVVQNWPYAVEVVQSIGGGVNVPDCFEVINGNPGTQVTNGLDPQPAGNTCNCTYKNYDPS